MVNWFMVNFRPLRIGVFPWLINGGGPNHLLTGIILQDGGNLEMWAQKKTYKVGPKTSL